MGVAAASAVVDRPWMLTGLHRLLGVGESQCMGMLNGQGCTQQCKAHATFEWEGLIEWTMT
jgi:hypothetical protein